MRTRPWKNEDGLGRRHGANLQIREIAHIDDGVAEARHARKLAFQELGHDLN